MNDTMTKLQRLQTVLEHHGAQPSSWPLEDRELVEFIKENTRAEQIYQEAQALDKLLDLSFARDSDEPENHAGLQQNILADFINLQQTKDDVVVAFPGKKNEMVTRSFADTSWMTATAMAACFAFGIYLGGIGIGEWKLDLTDSLASLSTSEDQLADISEYVMASVGEEDLL